MTIPLSTSFEPARRPAAMPRRLDSLSQCRLSTFSPTAPGAGDDARYLAAFSERAIDGQDLEQPQRCRSEKPLAWVGDVYSLVAQGRPAEAINVLFRKVDSLLRAGDLVACDGLLRVLDTRRLDSNLVVGVLSITLPAAKLLPSRTKFVERAERRLEELAPERVSRLLAGLK